MKKLFTFIITFALIISANTAFAESELTDMQGHKNQIAVEFLEHLNIINGHPDGTYRPDTGVNRAETLKLLFEAKGGEGLIEPTEECFPDVPVDEWYAIYVCSAKTLGYVEGYPDGNFKPANEVNKVETLKLIAMFSEWELSEGDGTEIFEDTDAEAWYADYIRYAKKKNLIEYDGNMWYPANSMPRGEIAEVIFRTALVKYYENDVFDSADVEDYLAVYGLSMPEITPDPDPDPTTPTSCSDAADALTIVQDQIVTGHEHESTMVVYQYADMLVENDNFAYYDENNSGQGVWIGADGGKWFFWVDYNPLQMFFHETKIATVDMNCNLEEYTSYLYPFINGTAVWSTMDQRVSSPDIVLTGEDAEEELAELLRLLTEDDPRFGTCGADPNELKRAVVVWVGEDQFIKRNAVNWYNHLCNNNYITTVVTGTSETDLKNNIEAELRAIEKESHDTGFNNVHWHFSSHGMKDTGDLFIREILTIDMDLNVISLSSDFLDIDELAGMFGEIAFTVGTEGIWSDSFTLIHDTCYSGNVVPKYQAEAYKPGERETAVGYILTATDTDEVGYATLLLKRGHYFTNALAQCVSATSHDDPDAFTACLSEKIIDLFIGPTAGLPQNPQIEKLSPLTDEYVPYMP